MLHLSENFTLEELTFSQTAVRKGIDNTPTKEIMNNLKRMAEKLEEVRNLVGEAVHVNSCYRCEKLNKEIGGAKTSSHLQGLAADITVKSLTPEQLAIKIRDSKIMFDQLIFEGTWVHIGIAGERREILTADFSGKPVKYLKGIV